MNRQRPHWGFNWPKEWTEKPKRKDMLTDEQLERLSKSTKAWLNSEEGKAEIRQAHEEAVAYCEEQERQRRANPIDLTRRITL